MGVSIASSDLKLSIFCLLWTLLIYWINFKVPKTLGSPPNSNLSVRIKTGTVVTGLEFLPPNLDFKMHDDLVKVLNPPNSNSHHSAAVFVVDLVLMFIRNLKALPIYKEDDGMWLNMTMDIMNIGPANQPGWCFNPFQLRSLVKSELRMYKMFKQIQQQQIRQGRQLIVLDSWLKDFETSSLRAIALVEVENKKCVKATCKEDPFLYVASHPTLTYRLIHRFVEDFPRIVKMLEGQYGKDFGETVRQQTIADSLKKLELPTRKDLVHSWVSFARMQDSNRLKTVDIANGILDGVSTNIPLDALNCLEIGAFYLFARHYDFAIQWLHLAQEKARKSPVLERHPEIGFFFEGVLGTAVVKHNENIPQQYSKRVSPGVFNTTVSLPFKPDSYIRRVEMFQELAWKEKVNHSEQNWAHNANFRRVCSGENLQSEDDKRQLYCWYDSPHQFWSIGPLKTELLIKDPRVVQVYEFIPESVLRNMKLYAVDKLNRSMVANGNITHQRTSMQTWLQDFKFVVELTIKLELWSGLVIGIPGASELYQVAMYGPSHLYGLHKDVYSNTSMPNSEGGRLVTIMGYLSDVKAGGRTGFPILGAFAEPVKGSIVMWSNRARNGTSDSRTLHGGCPVVLGVKWITNKWVNTDANMFTRPCSLNRNE